MSENETRRVRDYKNRDKSVEALERQKERDFKNATKQLLVLDERLGTGIGSQKERAKLHKMVERGKE